MTLIMNSWNSVTKNVIHNENGVDYGEGNENGRSIKFETKNIKSSLCDYSDTHILVIGDITAAGGYGNTNVAFKSCAPFTKCMTHINDEHIGTTESLDITISMYNMIEYSDNYLDTSGSLWQFKRVESNV